MNKTRNPFGVILLGIVTLGIYWLYWYYTLNKELLEHSGGKLNFSPGMALVAQFIPIAGFVSNYNTAKRMQTVKTICNDPDSISPGAALLFSILLPFGIYTYLLQSGMNNHWHHHGLKENATSKVEGTADTQTA